MANLNKVLLIGNLTRDPETRFLPSGSSVCEFGMAINRVWNDQQSGEKKEQTCFVDCVAYGRPGETIAKYMKKGRPIFVEGRLDYRSWETPEGQKRSKLQVVVDTFQFLGGPQEGGDRSGGPRESTRPERPERRGYGAPAASSAGGESAGMAMDDDDIPF